MVSYFERGIILFDMHDLYTTEYEYGLIEKIADRAIGQYPEGDRLTFEIDIEAVHGNNVRLRLKELLEAGDYDFRHDISGIYNNMNRETGKLENFFLPRYSMSEKETIRNCVSSIDGIVEKFRKEGKIAGTSHYDLEASLNILYRMFGEGNVNGALAAIVKHYNYDGRFTNDNKDWTGKIDTANYDDIECRKVTTHLYILDRLVNKARQSSAKRLSENSNNETEILKARIDKAGNNKTHPGLGL